MGCMFRVHYIREDSGVRDFRVFKDLDEFAERLKAIEAHDE